MDETVIVKVRELDPNKIRDEEKYDGFFAVITNLKDGISGILLTKEQI